MDSDKKSKRYSQSFRYTWLTMERFKGWLTPIKDNNLKCMCRYCKCIMLAKLSDIERHGRTNKHKKAGAVYKFNKKQDSDDQTDDDEVITPEVDVFAMDVDKLIYLVQCNPQIYDKNHEFYCNREILAKTWKFIAKELDTIDTNARKKWYVLYESYIQAKKKSLLYPEEEIAFQYFSSLEFLDTFIEGQIKQTILQASVQQTKAIEENSQVNPVDNCVAELVSTTSEPTIQTIQPVHQARKKSSNYGNEDADFLFLCSLLPMMKELGVIENLEFREEVIQVLKRKLQSQPNTVCISSSSEIPVSLTEYQPNGDDQSQGATSNNNAIYIISD